MPSTSKSQQRLMGQAYAIKSGELKPEDLNPEYRDEIVKLADSMTLKELKDFAETSHEGLLNKVEATNEAAKTKTGFTVHKEDETPATKSVDEPPVLDKDPKAPGGIEATKKEPAFTPSLYKAPMGKAKHDRRIMDFDQFLKVINYKTHDGILQKGHGQNLTGKG